MDFLVWCGVFSFGVGAFGLWVCFLLFDMLGIGFWGKCFMNTWPLLGLGCGIFLSLLALCLGGSRSSRPRGWLYFEGPWGPGVIVGVFLSHFVTGFSNKHAFATFYLGGAFTLPQGRKEVPNIIFSFYAKCMICENGIRTHTHDTMW